MRMKKRNGGYVNWGGGWSNSSKAKRERMLAYGLSLVGLHIKFNRLNLIGGFDTKFEWLISSHQEDSCG